MMSSKSKLFDDAVSSLTSLPGIGKRSATRLVLHFLSRPQEEALDFVNTIENLVKNIKYCKRCHSIADDDVCSVCLSPRREQGFVCIVESVRDVMAIEETGQFKGVYHVLGGIISPIEGVGPENLNIDTLKERLSKGVKEVVMAISPTIEGETTIYYLSQIIAPMGIKISTISRGVSFGGELEYTDEVTLGRSILARLPYNTNKE